MLKVKQVNSKGVKIEDLVLPKTMEVPENPWAVAQAVRVYEDNSHPGFAKVKTRSEVSVSTRKIYRQKGTGGARHGAKSAPIFKGGGVTHGPKGIKRVLKLSKNIKKHALFAALGAKIKASEVFAVSDFAKIGKAKEADQVLVKLTGSVKPISTLIALSKENLKTSLAFRNLKNVKVKLFESLTVYDLVNYKYIVLDSASFAEPKKVKTEEKQNFKGNIKSQKAKKK